MTRPLFVGLKLHGLVLDLSPEDVVGEKWTRGMNVFFKTGETWRCEGIGVFADSAFADAQFVHYVDLGQQEWWIAGGDQGIWVTDGQGNYYDVKPAGWAAIATKNFKYTVGDLNTLPFVNHPERGPFWWDGDPSHDFQPLPDWPSGWSCQAMRAHKNFLLAMGISTASGLMEGQVSWSSSADPGQVPDYWVPSPTNDAGDITFATPAGPIVDGISIRDQFFVSKTNATYAMQYVGGQFVFQARDVFPSVGLMGVGSVIEHDNFVYMVTSLGELARHDGNTMQNLLYGVGQDYFNSALNQEWPSSVFLYFTDQTGVLAIAYPTTPSKACTEALGIEIASIGREGGIDMGIRELPGVFGAADGFTTIEPSTWDTDSEAWDLDDTIWMEQPSGYRPSKTVFAGGANGLLELGKGTTVLGAPINAFVERTGLDLGDFSSHKVISGAFPRVEGQPNDTLYYRFAGQEQVRSPVNWGDEVPFVIGTSHQLDFFQDGRLIGYSIRSSGGSAWKLNGIQLLARKAGRW